MADCLAELQSSLLQRALAAAAILFASSSTVWAAAVADYKRMSLEELMDVPVFSASRRLEPTQSVPSAIFVLASDDIRRSGVTSIPEALRLVPGVQVGRVDANKWAVSMRGFNSREANKLLVLMDGRSIYDPLFSGVLWESQDLMLEDVERIEVIRGPGGTVWGANAFNGVINIISKRAPDTQGGLASVSVGDQERYTGALRYGWQSADEEQAARIYVKAYDHDRGHSDVAPPNDQSRMARSGFRWDWDGDANNDIRVSGDYFTANAGIREDLSLVQEVEHQGHNLATDWTRRLSQDNSLRLRFFYDFVSYESIGFDQDRRTYDLELQQTVQPLDNHLLILGGGYRRMRDRTQTAAGFRGFVDVLPERRDDALTNIFVQDTITLLPDALNLVLGLKYESTDYADAQWLPNLRVSLTPSAAQTWWFAISEATRVPSRLEADLTFLGTIRIGDNFEAEQVRAYEVGQRWLVTQQFWYDIAVFYNDYDDLRSAESGGALGNRMRGSTHGAELSLRWGPAAACRIDVAYTYLKLELELEPGSTGIPGQASFVEGLAPRHAVSIRTSVDVRQDLEIDATLRYVDDLPSLAFSDYTELDLGLSWRASSTLELSIVGQNLLDKHHPEQDFAFSASGLNTEVERQMYGKATWKF